MSDADGLIHRLESAAELKANGTTALQDGDPEAACAKYMAALEQLDLIPPGCPSESEQFRLLWAECIRQRAMLQLQCHLNAALGWLKLKEWGRAIDAAGAALLLDPQSAKAFFRRGLARKGQRHFEEAQKDLRQAAKLAPKDKAIRGELMIIANELEAASSTSQSEGFTVVKKGELASKLGAVFASGDLYADQPGASDGGMRADRLLEQADDQLDQGRVADALELCKAAMRAVKTMDGEEQARRFRCHAIGGRCHLRHPEAITNEGRLNTATRARADFEAALHILSLQEIDHPLHILDEGAKGRMGADAFPQKLIDLVRIGLAEANEIIAEYPQPMRKPTYHHRVA